MTSMRIMRTRALPVPKPDPMRPGTTAAPPGRCCNAHFYCPTVSNVYYALGLHKLPSAGLGETTSLQPCTACRVLLPPTLAPQGLWRGTVPGLLLTVPYTAVQFVALQQVRQAAASCGLTGVQGQGVRVVHAPLTQPNR